jgi:hypothetical protein
VYFVTEESAMIDETKRLSFKVGDMVRFLQPLSDDEASERFRVLELRGDRILVEAICDMQVKPTFVYPARDLMSV